MAGEWITLPFAEVVEDITVPVGGNERRRTVGTVTYQCRLCKTTTVPLPEDAATEQMLIHLQRAHGGVTDTEGRKMPVKARNRLISLGWTPPPDTPPPGPESNPSPPES